MAHARKVLSILLLMAGKDAAAASPAPARAAAPFLPNWFDETRETRDGLPPEISSAPLMPSLDFRVPAEYEPVAAVVLGWKSATDLLGDIAQAIATQTHAGVWAIEGPASLPGLSGERYLRAGCPLNSIWVRDYGPVGLSESTGQVGFVDSVYRHYQSRRGDDAVPSCLARETGVSAYGVDLVLDGGNFLIDSAGNLFMTERTYSWNGQHSRDEVDEILKRNYAAKNIFAIPYAGAPGEPADGTGHIDMFLKLLADDTVLISEASSEPFLTTVNRAVEFFERRLAPNGRPYRILRVPGWRSNGTWYTYTNSLIVNGVALIPSYARYPEQNQAARRVYEQAGLKAVLINSDTTISSGGSIHCVTQTVPARASAAMR